MSAQVAADLRAAAEVLRRDGWMQQQMHCNGKHCTAGALEVVVDADWPTGGVGWDAEQNRRFSKALAALAPIVGEEDGVVTWNDTPGRTADEVIAALEAAADAAEDDQ